MIRVIEGKLLIEPVVSSTNLGNGLSINNETQSRKDVVRGKCIGGKYVGSYIFYPLYAASPITYNGFNYVVIDERDVLAIEDDATGNNRTGAI